MAQSKDNVITHGLSGKVGDIIVFSQRNGKTIVSKVPKEKRGEDSSKQKAQQLRFQKAVLYAKAASNDPETKKIYAEKADLANGRHPYNLALADLLSAPEIQEINVSTYTGAIGDTISVIVTDDFMVKAVKVTIVNGDGTLVESGLAKEKDGKWVYTATKKNDNLSGDKLTIEASDLPANMTVFEQNL